MKHLTIVVKPFKVDAVMRALTQVGATAVTLTEARGYGRQKGRLDLYHEESAQVTFLPKVRVECVVEDENMKAATDAVVAAARTGRIGDGKVFIEEA
jgi:nitrogen regulatory protein P-II 1